MVLFLLEIMEYWCNEAGLLRNHTVHFMSGIIVNHKSYEVVSGSRLDNTREGFLMIRVLNLSIAYTVPLPFSESHQRNFYINAI